MQRGRMRLLLAAVLVALAQAGSEPPTGSEWTAAGIRRQPGQPPPGRHPDAKRTASERSDRLSSPVPYHPDLAYDGNMASSRTVLLNWTEPGPTLPRTSTVSGTVSSKVSSNERTVPIAVSSVVSVRVDAMESSTVSSTDNNIVDSITALSSVKSNSADDEESSPAPSTVNKNRVDARTLPSRVNNNKVDAMKSRTVSSRVNKNRVDAMESRTVSSAVYSNRSDDVEFRTMSSTSSSLESSTARRSSGAAYNVLFESLNDTEAGRQLLPLLRAELSGSRQDDPGDDQSAYLLGFSHNPWGASSALIHDEEALQEVLGQVAAPGSLQRGGGRSRTRRSVVHLYNMLVCATGCNPMAFKGYGCYCGFLGSGYTVDGIDRCCKMHDWCYDSANCPMFLEYFVPYMWKCYRRRPICALNGSSCSQRLCECDRRLAECLRRYPCPRRKAVCTSSPWRLLQNLFML